MKTKIIISSILIFLVTLIAVLFGAVFRLRKQSVKVVGDESITVSAEEIISSAKLNNGGSIFFLDKEKATANVEASIPNIKVIQIKTTSVTSVEIVVRARVETYYTYVNGTYYLMDEDLKVLNKTTNLDLAVSLIHIKDSLLDIETQTEIGDFVGENYQEIFYNLYTGIYNSATKVVDGVAHYLTRQEVINFVKDVTIEKGNTLTERYNRLIVKTSTGVLFDIAKPNENLQDKINMCISAYESGEYDKTQGTIKYYYLEDGTLRFDYFA